MRTAISRQAARYLAKRQMDLDNKKLLNPQFSSNNHWKSSRATRTIRLVLKSLQCMMGKFERCMYCHDSHGADIEHFWPKAIYPGKMYLWDNLLLCCTECGRMKGDRFPIDNDIPLLINPTIEDPWEFLEFDPRTGIISAKFDVDRNEFFQKGEESVKILCLDRREALQNIYKRTFKRIKEVVRRHEIGELAREHLAHELIEVDDAGLRGWLLRGADPDLDFMHALRADTDLWPQIERELAQ